MPDHVGVNPSHYDYPKSNFMGLRLFSTLIDSASTPDYDGWGVDTHWTCEDWVNWHKALVEKYGKEQADEMWVSAWLAGLSCVSGGTCTAEGSNYFFDSVPIDCRTFNSTFRSYIQKGENKKLYGAVYSGIGGVIATPLGWAADVGSGVGSGFKAMKVIIPLAIVGVSGMFLYWGYKHFMTKRVAL